MKIHALGDSNNAAAVLDRRRHHQAVGFAKLEEFEDGAQILMLQRAYDQLANANLESRYLLADARIIDRKRLI